MKLTPTTDAAQIAALNEPVQNLHHALYPQLFKAFEFEPIHAYFRGIVGQENHYFVLAEDAGTAIGYLWYEEVIRPESAFKQAEHLVYIHQVSVNEAYRGKGAGRLLLSAAQAHAEKTGATRIALDYWLKNANARAAYEKLGFTVTREVVFLDLPHGDSDSAL